MTLFMIAGKLWRYWFVTVPVIIATVCAGVYTVGIKEPQYEASGSYLLLNPPGPPTSQEIERNPSLARVRTDNPYTRIGDSSAPVQILASLMDTTPVRRKLVRAGADPRYDVRPQSEYMYASPIIEVVGTGPSAREAIGSARLVGEALVGKLDEMQAQQGVDERYRITSRQIDVPEKAVLKASGKLRGLIAVFAGGTVALFLVVSVADAVTTMRGRRLELAAGWPATPTHGFSPQDGPFADARLPFEADARPPPDDKATIRERPAVVPDDKATIRERPAVVPDDKAPIRERPAVVPDDKATIRERPAVVPDDEATARHNGRTTGEPRPLTW